MNGLEQELFRYFGYKTFRQGQKQVIESVLGGHDTLAMLPTGTGKTLCFQMPGLLLDGLVIIVSPLLALMQDQVEQMKARGEKRVAALNSFHGAQERELIIQSLRHLKFLYISPEMLQSGYILSKLREQNIALFVVDEAHCISQWGYDFRPGYLKLGNVRRKLGKPVTLALTATATKEVQRDIVKNLEIEGAEIYESSSGRENIFLAVEKVNDYRDKLQRLEELLGILKGSGIIYVSSRKMAENLCEHILHSGYEGVSFYHGGMETSERILIQQQFLKGQLQLIVATTAFGMGINKSDIRYVIHFQLPLSMESYVQEIGRAGRDGGKSIAILLYAEGDEWPAFQLVEKDIPLESEIDYFIHNQSEQNTDPLLLTETKIERLTELDATLISTGITEKRQRIQSLSQYFESRKKKKFAKLQLFLEWILSSECRKKGISKYFEQPNEQIEEFCCDQCGIKINTIIQMLPESSDDGYGNYQNWKLELARLFHREAGQIYEE